MTEPPQQLLGNIGATMTVGGVAGFVAAAEPYMKLTIFVLTVLVGVSTLMVNWPKIKAWWRSNRP